MNNWARELSKGIVSGDQLKQKGWLSQDVSEEQLEALKKNFDIRVPVAMHNPVKDNDEAVVNQFIPTLRELSFRPEELEDPIGDERFSPVEGVTHRYPDRVLLKPTYQCSAYCRFCFRRYKVSDSDYRLQGETLRNALRYIQEKTQVWEVILTGGDPLVLTQKRLAEIVLPLATIEHVKILRIHTRVPSLLPSRVNGELVDLFQQSQKTVFVVAHINTASELNSDCIQAVKRLQNGGFTVLAQSVLLKGVNDNSAALEKLFRGLVEIGVKPYYLHYPDLARGTSHFRVPLAKAISLVEGLRGKVSGLCIPQLIVDIPGGSGKVVVEPSWAKSIDGRTWEFKSPLTGEWVRVQYPEN